MFFYRELIFHWSLFYKKAILKKIKTIKDSCENITIDFVDANINEGVDKVLLPYIIKRTKMN